MNGIDHELAGLRAREEEEECDYGRMERVGRLSFYRGRSN